MGSILINSKDEDKQRIIDDISQKISKKIEDYAEINIKKNKVHDWQAAYSFSGKGSASDRAIKIQSIYSRTVPIPEEQMTEISKQFLVEIMKIIKDTIEENGGTVTSIFNN